MGCEEMGSPLAPTEVTGHAGNPPGNGPFMRVTLFVADGIVRDAAYETYQCPACHACGKVVCTLAKGKTIAEARVIDYSQVVEHVGPLQQSRKACYSLAVLALSDALDQYEKKGNETGT